MKQRTIRTLSVIAALPLLTLLILNSCSSTSSPGVQISKPALVIGDTIAGDTIGGYKPLKGTMKTGRTYYMDSDVVINNNDTLYMQQGVTVIVLPKTNYFPEFILTGGGTLISMGTAAQPNYISVPASYRTTVNLQAGLWGGIQCDVNSGDLVLKFTHISFAGGAGTAVGNGKKVAYCIYFQNPNANMIMEDSWLTGGTDDPVRTSAGKVSIFRNVFEAGSTTSGDGFNMKSGTIGDVAYNVFIGNCTNGPKEADKTAGLQVNANIYNNTIVCCGWRFNAGSRAGSIDIEDGAEGTVYNNIVVNCHTGFRLMGIGTPADTLHTYYDYEWLYGLTDSVRLLFYPGDKAQGFTDDGAGTEWVKPHDVQGAAGAHDPMFVGYDVTAVPASKYTFPIAFSDQDPRELFMTTTDALGQRFSDVTMSFKSDFHLKPGSPAIGTAFTGPSPVSIPMNVCPQYDPVVHPFGAITKGLGKDFGAYQSDGSGNVQ